MAGEETQGVLMTEEAVIRQCKLHHGYTTPELNEKLYLHHIGFTNISSLDAFHQCTVLYLNNNAIDNVEGLRPLRRLHALYLSNNALQDCCTLPALPSLRLLDISSNSMSSFEGLANAAGLETLLASRNCVDNLKALESLEHLITIDVSWNWISQPNNALPLIFTRAKLRTCMLQGNRFVKLVPSYRKTLVARIPSLLSLDNYPIFPEERSCAEAYIAGGAEAEEAQRQENERQEAEERERQFRYFGEAQALVREHRLSHGPRVEPTVYFDDNDSEGIFVPNR